MAALCGLGADVVGLLEMENDGNGTTSALTELTNALTATNGCGSWAYVPNPSGWGTIPAQHRRNPPSTDLPHDGGQSGDPDVAQQRRRSIRRGHHW